jgi:hypothetical protein
VNADHRSPLVSDARYTQPEAEQAILLHKLQLRLPQQPPPRIKIQHPSQSVEALQAAVPTF